MVQYGIDRVSEFPALLRDGRVALLTSVTGRSSDNRSTIDLLHEQYHLTALLGPEHGVRGDQAAGVLTGNYTDPHTGLTVFSLYSAAGKRLRQEMLDTFDILVCDLQDVGLRFYTFLSTVCYLVEDCAKHRKRLVVLDRPAPLGGGVVEGGLLQEEYKSFVGCRRVPVRYGLTLGEFAKMVNETENLGCDLEVVPCGNWHGEPFPQWGQIWQMPSLALPTFEGTAFYAGNCVFEGTALSEGRGTAAPFRIIGAPGVDSERFTRAFNELKLPGAVATPVYFVPTCSKHQGENCGGLMLHLTDFAALRPVELGLRLLDLFQKLYPEQSAFLPPPEDGGRPFISLITGCGDFVPGWDCDAVLSRYEQESAAFAKEKAAYHLYERV